MAVIVLLGLALAGALGFGVWAYAGREDYKNNVDQKIAAAIKVAAQKTASAKDNELAEKEKLPLRTYRGPDTYGGAVIKYPKTWSAYVIESRGNSPLGGYFHPSTVPGVSNDTVYALRLQVVSSPYSEVLKQYENAQNSGEVKISAFRAPKVPSALGARLDGEVAPQKQGVMVILPLRDKTLKIWTESSQYVNDLTKNVLANLTFSP